MTDHARGMKREHPPARWQVALGTTWAFLCAAGLILAGVVVAVHPGDIRQHHVALQLRDEGRSAAATVGHGWASELTFRANGTDVTVEVDDGVDLSHRDANDAVPVLYLPSDPQVVMPVVDVTYYAEDAVADGRYVFVMGLAPAVLTLLAWQLSGRPRWGRYVSDRWVPSVEVPSFDIWGA